MEKSNGLWPILTKLYRHYMKNRSSWKGIRFALFPSACYKCGNIIWLEPKKIEWVPPGYRHDWCLDCKPISHNPEKKIEREINRVFFWFRVIAAALIVLYIVMTLCGLDPYWQSP